MNETENTGLSNPHNNWTFSPLILCYQPEAEVRYCWYHLLSLISESSSFEKYTLWLRKDQDAFHVVSPALFLVYLSKVLTYFEALRTTSPLSVYSCLSLWGSMLDLLRRNKVRAWVWTMWEIRNKLNVKLLAWICPLPSPRDFPQSSDMPNHLYHSFVLVHSSHLYKKKCSK